MLRFIFQGLTNKDIGTRLNISESAVKSSLRQLFEKLGVRTRAQLVKVALERSLRSGFDNRHSDSRRSCDEQDLVYTGQRSAGGCP